VAAVQPGEELVVLGAGGGVGLAAVQLGSVLGATVTAVASSAGKLEVAAEYGAARLICHRPGDLRQALREALPDGADVVVDPVGGDLAEPALRAMRWGGRFVTVGYASGVIPRIPLNLVLLKGVHLIGFQLRDFATHAPDELRRNERELLDMLAAHRAVPYIGATFDSPRWPRPCAMSPTARSSSMSAGPPGANPRPLGANGKCCVHRRLPSRAMTSAS
jgi:NADPH:quinone reductase